MLRLAVTAHLLGLRLHDGYRGRLEILRDRENRDRGDIVQTVIIVASMAIAALVVLGIIIAKVNNWGSKVPDSTSNPASTCTSGSRSRAAYHSTTCAAAASRSTPGDPSARQEFARLYSRPTGAGSVRSTQSPNGSVTTPGNIRATRSSASRAGTRCRTEGRGGTGLPDTMSARGIRTGGPDDGSTTQPSGPKDTQVPRMSVKAGPPVGPVSPRTKRRTTTRCPTTCGPRKGVAKGWASSSWDTPGY